ncbi:MAG: hypothetical protein JSV24_02215, partial [Bacteroidales bacterium]
MKFYIPPQVKRLSFFLVIFIAIFLLTRHLLTPDTFGEFGHYRGASLQENASLELLYAGQESCNECHQEIMEMKEQDLHSDVTCESCHDSGYKHVQSPDSFRIYIPRGRKFCGICHSLNTARSTEAIFQVDLNEHNIDKDCIDCHNP